MKLRIFFNNKYRENPYHVQFSDADGEWFRLDAFSTQKQAENALKWYAKNPNRVVKEIEV